MPQGLDAILNSIAHVADEHGPSPAFAVAEIPSFPGHYVGRDRTGSVCLLLGSRDGPSGVLHPPIRLSGLEVTFSVPCNVILPNKVDRREVLTVIICSAGSDEMTTYFLRACEAIIRIVGNRPAISDVAKVVGRLADLFRKLSMPPSRKTTALFAELLFIRYSAEPQLAARAWRSDDYDRFDFSIDDVRLEVKANGDRHRVHVFSREQCEVPGGVTGILASFFVEQTGGGLSIGELVAEISAELAEDAELLLKVQDAVASTLGAKLVEGLAVRFDDRLARSSLHLYPLERVPAIRGALPPGVSDVHFRSDLSSITPEPRAAFAARSRTAAGLLPK